MKHRDRPPEQDDLLWPRPVELIEMHHEFVNPAEAIDRDRFEQVWVGLFPSTEGRPATHPSRAASLMCLQHVHGPSDAAVVARWVENPCILHVSGETLFQHSEPIHRSSLSRWRDRIGSARKGPNGF